MQALLVPLRTQSGRTRSAVAALLVTCALLCTACGGGGGAAAPIATDAPRNLVYTAAPAVYRTDAPIVPNTVTYDGDPVTNWECVPPLPDGLEVRPVTQADLPRIWDAMLEAFRDHHGGHDDSEAAFQRWTVDPVFDLSLVIIAFDGEEVAGGVQGWVDPDENEANGYRRGWTDPVFTRRPWRRRGLAHALLGRALLALRDRGMTSAQLGVDSENPYQALTLYERHRFKTVRTGSEWTRVIGP